MQATKRPSDEATKGRKNDRAFTLMEIMIVIAIIVLMLPVAFRAFTFIPGSRSAGAAENVISAMLGRARAYAIANQTPAGVAFFIDPQSQRTTMAVVIRGIASSGGAEDPYFNYRGWSTTSYQ